MSKFISIQTLEHVAQQSETVAVSDPYGWKVTVVSLTVVLLSLLILYICYTIIGIIVKKSEKVTKEDKDSNEAQIVEDQGIHDNESYKLTLSRKHETTTHADYSSICKIHLTSATTEENDSENRQQSGNEHQGIITSPLPGLLTSLNVKVGDKVSAGQVVAKLEAMKMDNSIEADFTGTVTEIYVSKGDTLLEGTSIMKIQ